MKRLLIVPLTLMCLLSLAWAADVPSAPIEAIPPSPLMLKAPEDVEGDFTIAKEAPRLDFCILPNQWEGARLWSSWGDAVWASDGNVYTSIGDHDGPHGTAYIYRIDPDARRADLVIDVDKALGLTNPERYAPGKIHAPIVDAGDGWLYFATYPGSSGKANHEVGYKGDFLARYQMDSGRVEKLGILVPDARIPSMELDATGTMLLGLAVPGPSAPDSQTSLFYAYSLPEHRTIFTTNSEGSMQRAIMTAPDTGAYFDGGGELVRYDPAKSKATRTSIAIPGDASLRAASLPDANGVIYGITRQGTVFAFDTKANKTRAITKAFVTEGLYTAVCRLSPSGRYLYYVPSAHGKSYRHGTAVIQLDVKTGSRKVLCFLNRRFRETHDYNLGGTFSLALSPDGSMLYIGWNGAPVNAKKQKEFGLCSAMIVHIPEGERNADR